jgi:hypothetical protein
VAADTDSHLEDDDEEDEQTATEGGHEPKEQAACSGVEGETVRKRTVSWAPQEAPSGNASTARAAL